MESFVIEFCLGGILAALVHIARKIDLIYEAIVKEKIK